MIRDLGGTQARSRIVFEAVACALLALTVPLSSGPVLDASAAAGMAVFVLLLGMLVAFGGRYAVHAGRAVATQLSRSTDPGAGRSAAITDTPRHPIRPRAPGLV